MSAVTTTEKISLLVSLFSLLISVLTALKSYLLSEYQLRLNTRNELQKMLIEVNKCMINDPELWATYDHHEVSASIKQSHTPVAKIEAISYMMLNTFEAAFAFYEDSPRLRKAELESYETWKGYFHE